MVGLPNLGEENLRREGKNWKMERKKRRGMGLGMAGGALLVLGEFESLLRELGPINEGLAISLTINIFLCKRRKEYGCKRNEE